MRGIRFLIYFFIFLLLLSAGIVFGLQNSQMIQIKFLTFETMALPLWVFVLGALLIGMLVTGSICFIEFVRMHLEYRHVEKKFSRVRRELNDQRNYPLNKP